MRGRGSVESKIMTSAKRKSTMSSINLSIIQVGSFKCRVGVPLFIIFSLYTGSDGRHGQGGRSAVVAPSTQGGGDEHTDSPTFHWLRTKPDYRPWTSVYFMSFVTLPKMPYSELCAPDMHSPLCVLSILYIVFCFPCVPWIPSPPVDP